jgi:hypothetical protein
MSMKRRTTRRALLLLLSRTKLLSEQMVLALAMARARSKRGE